MGTQNLLQLFDRQLRQDIEYPEARREITGDVIRFVREAPGMNFISYTFATESELERVITHELEYFSLKQQPFTWKVCSHDPNQIPLTVRLKKHHFEADDEPGDFMVLDVENGPAYLFEPSQMDIRRISDLAGLKDVIEVLDKVYGGSNIWVNGRLGSHLQIPGYLSVYTAYADDQPVSIAWTYFQKGQFDSLFAGSTLPEFRNQGFYTALLSTRLQEIRTRGYRYAAVEAGPMSRPIVEKHGFQYLTTQTDYIWRGQAYP